jgi:hypothetical protein
MKKRTELLALSMVLMLTFVATGVAEAFFTYTKSIVNNFHTGTVKYTFTEEFCAPTNWNPADCTPKELHINNTGTKAIYVRFKVIPHWEGNLNTNNVTFTVNNPNVIKIGDWYYYKKVLGAPHEMPSAPTCIVINSKVCLLGSTGNEYQDKDFTLEIKTEGIQAKNNAAQMEWQLTDAQMQQIGLQPYSN